MASSELTQTRLRHRARRAYELARAQGALLRGAGVGLLALPGFFQCHRDPVAAICLGGFALAVAAGRFRGEASEEGSRSGAIAGIVPCLLPAATQAVNPGLCMTLFYGVPWLCAIGGLGAGVILGLRSRAAAGWSYWSSALVALGFAAAVGCIPAGLMGLAGLVAGVLVGAAPALLARRAAA